VQLFIGDVLLFVSLISSLEDDVYHTRISRQSYQLTTNSSARSASDLLELLQKSAVEHLTVFRQIEARDFGSVATIVTTDFEALHAYKRSDYQRCLQLSTQNVHTLWYSIQMYFVPIFWELLQLLDDDMVSLSALIVNGRS